jgi:hypothetical protein
LRNVYYEIATMKMPHYFLLSGIICLLSVNSYAGNKLPVNARGEAVYKHSFKLQANVKAEDAYNLAQDWFKSGPEVFTCENIADPIDGSGKNKAFVEDAFKNPQPLQSLDPAAGRMAGKGVIKYYGSVNSTLGVLYMEYYVVLEVNGNELTATVSKMKYHHYNPRTYAEKPIYGWSGGEPFDAADKLENLVNNATENRDVQKVGAFVNKKVAELLSNLQSYLQSAKLLDATSFNQVAITED